MLYTEVVVASCEAVCQVWAHLEGAKNQPIFIWSPSSLKKYTFDTSRVDVYSLYVQKEASGIDCSVF